MSAVLETHELGRWYGQVVGLNELSVTITGGVTGLVGPNGAGKSTLLKLIAGEIKPSRGSIRVLGLDPFANRELYRRVGFCPQQDALYDGMSAFEMLRFLLRLSGRTKKAAGELAEHALIRAGLERDMHRRCGTYSKGMRQRARVAQAIAHEPELLVLDEPMSGLDPIGRRDMLELLRTLASGGISVLLSSHVLHEIEDLTAEVLLLHRGRLLAQGKVPEVRRLLNKHPRKVELRARNARPLARVLLGCEEVISVRLAESDLLALETHDVDAFFRSLTPLAADGRFGITSLESVDASLEAVFDYLVA